jgi:phosphoglucomutase
MSAINFANNQVEARIKEWTNSPYDQATRDEIAALLAAGKKDELEDRFYKPLEFGTGGLRGKLGAGTNRMNSYVVARATQGLANYVRAHATRPGPLRAAIAHDSRHRSREFAETAAGVFAANGIIVHISPELRPTPYLSYAVRELGCHTGIMVTASHNPKEYNGYKVYWDDGSQVIPPHDEGIITEVNKVTGDDLVKRVSFEEGVAKGLIKVMGDEMDEAFLDAVLLQRFDKEIIRKHQPTIVYTPLHGVGGTMAPRALAMWGFEKVLPEPEQMKPNGDFPTAASPNPEEGAALDRAIQLARREQSELVLATDPDADRLGIAVRHAGEYHLVTGNQVSALLCDFIIRNRQKLSPAGTKFGVVTTVVTSPLVQKVANGLGAECPLVLTGFKWIADMMRKWIAKPGSPAFLYGTEESYGYLIGNHTRDKDGIVAACAVAEMTAHAKSHGRTLIDELHELYRQHGVHFEWTKSVTLPGIAGAEKIKAILNAIRANPPRVIAGRDVTRFSRLDTGEVFENGRPAGRLDLPASDVFLFDLRDGSRVIVRPSGTEPKIKFYFFLCDPTRRGNLDEVKAAYIQLEKLVPDFEARFLKTIGV